MFTWMKRWIERLGEKNERLYGTGSLSCCGLNHSQVRPRANAHLVRRMRQVAESGRREIPEPRQ